MVGRGCTKPQTQGSWGTPGKLLAGLVGCRAGEREVLRGVLGSSWRPRGEEGVKKMGRSSVWDKGTRVTLGPRKVFSPRWRVQLEMRLPPRNKKERRAEGPWVEPTPHPWSRGRQGRPRRCFREVRGTPDEREGPTSCGKEGPTEGRGQQSQAPERPRTTGTVGRAVPLQ